MGFVGQHPPLPRPTSEIRRMLIGRKLFEKSA